VGCWNTRFIATPVSYDLPGGTGQSDQTETTGRSIEGCCPIERRVRHGNGPCGYGLQERPRGPGCRLGWSQGRCWSPSDLSHRCGPPSGLQDPETPFRGSANITVPERWLSPVQELVRCLPRPESTPNRRRRCGSRHDRRRSHRVREKSQNPSQNFRRFATMGHDTRRQEQEKIPSHTYFGRLVPSRPNALMSFRKPTLYPLSYGGNGW
jgi:hypothetical protein